MLTRRSFSGLLVTAGGLVAAGVVGIPVAIAALSPALGKRQRERWRRLGRLDAFPVGAVATAMVPGSRRGWPGGLDRPAVFVWRPRPDEVTVFSRSCTDLACPLNYDPGSACFFCPCHGGIFARDGTVMAGPPSRPMDRYASRVKDGVLEIDLASVPAGS